MEGLTVCLGGRVSLREGPHSLGGGRCARTEGMFLGQVRRASVTRTAPGDGSLSGPGGCRTALCLFGQDYEQPRATDYRGGWQETSGRNGSGSGTAWPAGPACPRLPPQSLPSSS